MGILGFLVWVKLMHCQRNVFVELQCRLGYAWRITHIIPLASSDSDDGHMAFVWGGVELYC